VQYTTGQNIHCGLHAQTKLAPLTSQIMSCMEYLLSNATIIVLVNGNGHINKVKLRRAWLVQGLVGSVGLPPRYSSRPTQPGHPSMYKCNMSTGDGLGHRWGKNGEFCVEVGLITKDCRHVGLLYASLIGSIKVKGDELPHDKRLHICKSSSYFYSMEKKG